MEKIGATEHQYMSSRELASVVFDWFGGAVRREAVERALRERLACYWGDARVLWRSPMSAKETAAFGERMSGSYKLIDPRPYEIRVELRKVGTSREMITTATLRFFIIQPTSLGGYAAIEPQGKDKHRYPPTLKLLLCNEEQRAMPRQQLTPPPEPKKRSEDRELELIRQAT